MEQHSLHYKPDGIEISGVTAVESFDQKCVLLHIDSGILELRGGGFVLKDMTSDSGKLSFTGKIRSLEYKEKIEASSLLKKLFK